MAPQVARVGLELGLWDFFALVMFALTVTASLAGPDMLKGLTAGTLGLLAAIIAEVLKRWAVLLRSALIDVFTGILPGTGGSVANILAYDQAKKTSKYPEKFGTGIADGIVARESSNNATEGGD